MTLNCPACRKPNESDADNPVCARCGCELTALRAIALSADRHLAMAAAECRHKHWRKALRHAERSWTLRHQAAAARLAFLAAAALGETAGALAWNARGGYDGN